ncbi:MAG: DoxX family protein [Chitinophagaceae bacterium]|nr:DoxX family protein [Chitinophagaceae bacterium]
MKRLFSTKYSDNSVSFDLLMLRLATGGLMIQHGYDKLVKFAVMSKGFPDPFGVGNTASLSMLVFAEFFCAILILAGLLTRLATIPLIIAMSVALFKAHNGQIFGEGEHAALFLGGYIALLFAGPGKISIDRLIGK